MARRSKRYCLLLATLPLLPLLLLTSAVHAQMTHPYGLEQMMYVSDNDLTGTPRFVGMVGAMTAVGGDPSAVKQNPAGLGVYRHSQFSVSADGTFSRFWQPDAMGRGELYSRWHLSQVSYVFSLTHAERVAGVVGNNIMISYAKRTDILMNVTLNDRSMRKTDAQDWLEMRTDEYGYRNDVDFHYAMNISNRVYWGVGLTMEWAQVRQTIDRWEYTAEDKRGRTRIYDLSETATGRTVGVGGSIGVLVHPIQMLRIGLSVESPVTGRMRETDYYDEHISYPNTEGQNVNNESPDYGTNWQMVTPLKISTGVGLQWKQRGLLSLQYDMQYHNLTGVAHTARAGLEVAMNNHWMLETGYAYSTLFDKQRASLGVNYMGKWLRVGVAYSFGWSRGKVLDYPLYRTEQGMYRTSESRLVFSFQWNS